VYHFAEADNLCSYLLSLHHFQTKSCTGNMIYIAQWKELYKQNAPLSLFLYHVSFWSFFKKKKSSLEKAPWSFFVSHIHTHSFVAHSNTHLLFSLACSCTLLEVLLSYMFIGIGNTIGTKDLHILISLADFYWVWRALKPEKALNINCVALYPTEEYLFS